MRRRVLIAVAALAAVALATTSQPSRADRTTRAVDLLWTAPDFASRGIRSIAMLPAATYDGSVEARRLTETAVAQAFKPLPYRWISTIVTRDQISSAGGDSLLKALNDQLLREPRLDSLQAPAYAHRSRASALFTVRVDQFEKRELEFNQSGKPTTTVQLHVALVDSTGHLLWTASGTENAEGPYQDPSTNPIGVNASGLNNQPLTNQGKAPSFPETLRVLLARFAERFPAPPGTEAPAK